MENFKQTSQRLAIIDYLKDNKNHPTVEEIFKSVKDKNPHVSLATVYNTIDMLKKRGIISELTINSTKRRYDPNPNYHHHFICLSCKNVFDIEEKINITLSEELKNSYKIHGYEIDLYGYCNNCKKELSGID
ncbi:MAG TPA: transcriptional repressor [Nitrospirae bacterium]|nr:transcriptional repressor [Nitrospirota bacterium]